MKAPLFFLLLATFQICLGAPIVNDCGDTDGNGTGGAGGAGGRGGAGGDGSPAIPLGTPDQSGAAPCADDNVMHSPIAGADAVNTPAKVGRGQKGALGHAIPLFGVVDETKSRGAEGAEKTAESASHLDLNQTAQNALATGDTGVDQSRKALTEVGFGGPGAAVEGVYTPVSLTAHGTSRGVADSATGMTGGLTGGGAI